MFTGLSDTPHLRKSTLVTWDGVFPFGGTSVSSLPKNLLQRPGAVKDDYSVKALSASSILRLIFTASQLLRKFVPLDLLKISVFFFGLHDSRTFKTVHVCR